MTVRRSITFVTLIGAAIAAAACSEHLAGGAACPALCPQAQPTQTDTTFRIDHLSPVYDTTVASFPLLGTESALLLANIRQQVDVRGIIRFDSLTNTFSRDVNGTFTNYAPTVAHDALVLFTVPKSTIQTTRGSDQIQFLIFDVDTTADTTISVLSSMFTSPHFLGASRGFIASGFRDSLSSNTLDTVIVHLDTAKVFAKLQGDRKLRLGIVAVVNNSTSDGVRLNIGLNPAPFIRYFGTSNADSLKKDSATFRITSDMRSVDPVTDPELAGRLAHYPLIVQGALPDSTNALNIGGIPARRVYLHFQLPPRIIDTANVIRATLLLHPKPQPTQLPGDTMALYPWPVISSNKVKTAAQATNFIISNTAYSLDSVQVVPYANSVVALDFVNAVKAWQNVSDTVNTRALVLRVLTEGTTPLETSFWSSFAPDTALRPHVRIVYVKRSGIGLP